MLGQCLTNAWLVVLLGKILAQMTKLGTKSGLKIFLICYDIENFGIQSKFRKF
jgi:hypothetical protein